MLNHPCINPGINPTWSWYVILLRYYWIWFANISWEFSYLYLSGLLTCSVFSCIVLVWFWHKDNAGLIKWIWKCFILFYFGGELEKVWYQFFLKCLVEFSRILVEFSEIISSWNHRFLDFCLLRDFWLLILMFLVVIGLFRCSISLWFSLGRLYVSGNSSISSKLSNFLVCNVS